MDFKSLSRWFILAGVCLLTVGVIFWLLGKILPRNIPGPLKIQMGNATIFFPIFLSIILSIVLTLVLNIIARLFNH